MKNSLIIRLNDSNSLQVSPEGVKINKLGSSISPINFIKLLQKADNKVNPRIANVNKITKSIHETLEISPELLFFKSKGILLATESCKILERNRIEITLDNFEFEGIMDGGHNTFAIAIFIIEKLFDITIKKWDECKAFWDENYDEILRRFEERESEFQFSIPIEIITPNDEDGAVEEYYDYISEICSARNNNVQLSETAKGNQVGFYETLKSNLETKFDVIWKSGDHGKIKSEDVISLASLPLIFLKNNGLLPKDIKGLNKISIYSQKSKCVDFFNSVMAHEDISQLDNGKYILEDKYVASALLLTEDILRFFDKMYIEFPNLYHHASPGKFGRITAVNNKKTGKVPFFTTETEADYQYSFGFFYPLISGLTELMGIDEKTKSIGWIVNPNELNLSSLDLTQYVNIIKLVNFDPQKIGKGEVFYNEAESVFSKILV
jgi:hypothetical protein